MKTFYLTAEQEDICFQALEAARIDYELRKPGMVIAQIGLNKKGTKAVCTLAYVEAERANTIKEILERGHVAKTQRGGK